MGRRRLDPDALARAREFLLRDARPLEAARFHFHFEGGSRDDVLEALAAFQNEDGGFGQALEPDLRAPESSAIATSVAFQVLREVDAVRDAPLADRAVGYLLDTFDAERGGWRIVPPTTDASPHAPWWRQEGREHDYDRKLLNPGAELLGYLLERGGGVPAEVLARAGERVTEELAASGDLEMHDLLCCLRLDATHGLPEALRAAVRAKLASSIESEVARDPSRWGEYALRPLQVADRPDARFLPGLEEAVEANLDVLVDEQQDDGSWAPTWIWGDDYRDLWVTARQEWCGILTLEALRVLRRFGRMS